MMGGAGVWSSLMRELPSCNEMHLHLEKMNQCFNTFSNHFQLLLVQDVLHMQLQNMLFRYFLTIQFDSILI